MPREEHLEWCKQRAREYLDRGDIANGISSMLSDLNNHPETKQDNTTMSALGLLYAMNKDLRGARRFIEGFN